jgi:hypothetical protein
MKRLNTHPIRPDRVREDTSVAVRALIRSIRRPSWHTDGYRTPQEAQEARETAEAPHASS